MKKGSLERLPVYAIGNDGNETTQIGTISIEMDDDDWYSLDGRKLSGKPKKKGLYIHKGKSIIFKNGITKEKTTTQIQGGVYEASTCQV